MHRFAFTARFALAIVFTIAVCGVCASRAGVASAAEADEEMTVRGVVVDTGGAPAADVSIQAHVVGGDLFASSDADGRFEIAVPHERLMGGVRLIARAVDRRLIAQRLFGREAIDELTGETVRLELAPATAVLVDVRDADGEPVAGATVAARAAESEVSLTVAETDDAGKAGLLFSDGASLKPVMTLKLGGGLD